MVANDLRGVETASRKTTGTAAVSFLLCLFRFNFSLSPLSILKRKGEKQCSKAVVGFCCSRIEGFGNQVEFYDACMCRAELSVCVWESEYVRSLAVGGQSARE
jgi:hypothetical protein